MARILSDKPDTVRIWVDFNETRNGCLISLSKFADAPIEPGTPVLCEDHEGNSVEGVVEQIIDKGRGDVVYIRPNWDTW